jgi:hypothetical protein
MDIFSIIVLVAFYCVSIHFTLAASQCSGAGFDLTSLAGKSITGSDSTFDYYLSVCGICSHSIECSKANAALCAYIHPDYYELNLAKWTATTSPAPAWNIIADGVAITFQNADAVNGRIPKTIIQVHCGPPNQGSMSVSMDADRYIWTVDLVDSSGCGDITTGTYFGARFTGNYHSIFGFTAHSVNVLQSTPSRSAFPGTVNTNFNNGELTIINNPDVMESRVIKNQAINGLFEWWLQEITDQAIFELLLPDNLQKGTFKLTFLGSGFPNNTPIPLSATSLNIKVLSSWGFSSVLGTTPTTIVNFQVTSSAIQAGISGPTKSGSYLMFNISHSATHYSPTILMSIDLIDPAIGQYF